MMTANDKRMAEFKMVYIQNELFVRKSLYYIIRTPSKVDDVVQEVFIKIWRNFSQFEEKSSIKTWIYKITLNCAYDFLRKEKRHPNADQLKFPEQSSEEKSQPIENQELILNAIDLLNPKQRGPFVMFYLQELTLEEISSALNIPSGTLKSRLHKSREIVTNYFTKHGVQL